MSMRPLIVPVTRDENPYIASIPFVFWFFTYLLVNKVINNAPAPVTIGMNVLHFPQTPIMGMRGLGYALSTNFFMA